MTDLPKIGAPATRALANVGITTITTLEQVANRTEAEISRLHGVGPKAIRSLEAALRAKGLRFA